MNPDHHHEPKVEVEEHLDIRTEGEDQKAEQLRILEEIRIRNLRIEEDKKVA